MDQGVTVSRTFHRSPSLPPLAPSGGRHQTSCAESSITDSCSREPSRSQRFEVGKKRFSQAEQLAMGRRPFERLPGLGRRACSQPAFLPIEQGTCTDWKAQDVSAIMDDPTMSQEQGDGTQDRVQAAIERLLPTSRQSFRSNSSGTPRLQLRRRASSHELLPPIVAPENKLPKDALDQLRIKLLQSFKSLYDAKIQLEHHSTLERQLGPMELRKTLVRLLGGPCDELDAVIGPDWVGNMTFRDLFNAFGTASPEALFWELRCRLKARGLWPQEIKKAQSLALQCLKNAEWKDSESLETGLENEDISRGGTVAAVRFSRSDWIKFIVNLGLTNFDAKQLYKLFRDKCAGIDLRSVFETAHATVACDMTLMRFAKDILKRYGSLRLGFGMWCRVPAEAPLMRRKEFNKLAAELDVKERHTAKLWSVIGGGKLDLDAEEDDHSSDISGERCMTEDDFVRMMVRWRPDSALDSLREQLYEHCGSLSEGRRALGQQGLGGGGTLSPRRLHRGLRAVGITRCDSDCIVAAANGGPRGHEEAAAFSVTLEDVIDYLRDIELRPTSKNSNASQLSEARRSHADADSDCSGGVRLAITDGVSRIDSPSPDHGSRSSSKAPSRTGSKGSTKGAFDRKPCPLATMRTAARRLSCPQLPGGPRGRA